MLKQLPTVAIVCLMMIPIIYYWDQSRSKCDESKEILPHGEMVVSIIGVCGLLFLAVKIFAHRGKAIRLGQRVKASGQGLMSQAAEGGFGKRRW